MKKFFCRSVRIRNEFGEMDNCLASLLLFVEIKQKSQEKNKKSQNLGNLMKQYVEMDKKDKTGSTYIHFSLIFFHEIIFTKKKKFHEKKNVLLHTY